VVLRLIVNAVALLATTVVPGIQFGGGWISLFVAGAIFGIFNAVVRPVALILSIPFLIVTLGLFYFVLNGGLLWAASFLLPGYSVSGLVPGILGSLVISIVNWAVQTLISDGDDADD
jgi:putative membrane protein